MQEEFMGTVNGIIRWVAGPPIEPRLASRRVARELMRDEPHCGRARCATSPAFFADMTTTRRIGARLLYDSSITELKLVDITA